MDREDIVRDDFPGSSDGYDRPSVDAHLSAVAAYVDALKARVEALGVEIEAIRDAGQVRSQTDSRAVAPGAAREDEGPTADRDRSEDLVSARLVVSKLHLEGSGRDEIVGRIVAEYRLEDPEDLVDEVIEGLS
jgi:hypothetical protein